jgi:tetratricopeptide (TPR) repeat protein
MTCASRKWRWNNWSFRIPAPCEEALTLNQEVGDARGISVACRNRALLKMSVGDYDGASALYEESLKCRQAIGEPRGAAYMMTNVATFERLDDRQLLAWTLSVEGLLASAAGRSGEAFSCFERSVALCRLVDSMLGLA